MISTTVYGNKRERNKETKKETKIDRETANDHEIAVLTFSSYKGT